MKRLYWLAMTVLILGMAFCASTVMAAARNQDRVNPAPKCNKKAVVWTSLEMPQKPKAGDIWTNPVDGMPMVYISKGSFHMGNDDVADERPYRRVNLDGYWIARYEITVAQYRKFCQVTNRPMPSMPSVKWLNDSPIVNVSWNDAAAYAKWANGRLPEEAEWEKAARCDKNKYPWGNKWDPACCNNGLEGENAPTKVGSYPKGTSEYGVFDLAGNVAEWCASMYKKPGDLTEYHVVRGGSCQDVNTDAYLASHRDCLSATTSVDVVGFRYVLPAL
ncbi:MAG TPA: SUMF1/EgtB/PvdO family nonheme iron enzyme [Armatimonadota bacterium]|nr:SUMF1/EgtB/PvdO family nonheme iron enzyme [Armatimonadota bacterium]